MGATAEAAQGPQTKEPNLKGPNLMTLRSLRSLRLSHSPPLTQRQLANTSGVGLRTIVNIENRHSQPRMEIRKQLLEALGIPMDRHREIFGVLPGERPSANAV